MQRALGILETYGLLCAVAAADTMVKAANVELIGYELSRGAGMTTVKIEGDVGAVKAALASGEAQAKELGLFRGKDLIPRPAENLDMMVYSPMTVGYEGNQSDKGSGGGSAPAAKATAPAAVEEKPAEKADAKAEEKVEVKVEEKKPEPKKPEPKKPAKKAAKKVEKKADKKPKAEAKKKPTCNLCGDPKCPREFGQPHKVCIHYGGK